MPLVFATEVLASPSKMVQNIVTSDLVVSSLPIVGYRTPFASFAIAVDGARAWVRCFESMKRSGGGTTASPYPKKEGFTTYLHRHFLPCLQVSSTFC